MTHQRILSLLAAAAIAAAGPALAQQPAAKPAADVAPNAYKIGFVNTDKVMRESRTSQQAQKALEAEFVKRDKEIAAGPPAEVARRRNALNEDMVMRREDALKQLVDKANAVIRRIAEAEKFDLVFLEAAYASPRIDLTDKVIKALDAAK
jgi:outer membrane protein